MEQEKQSGNRGNRNENQGEPHGPPRKRKGVPDTIQEMLKVWVAAVRVMRVIRARAAGINVIVKF